MATTKRKSGTPHGAAPTHPYKIDQKSWNKQRCIDILCEKIATSTLGIPALLAEGHDGNMLPTYTAVKEWLAEDPKFAAQFARAKADQADHMAEEMLDIADDGTNDWMESNSPHNPGWVANGEHIQRSRLRLDARKWLMSKLAPKKYGDKQEIEHTGNMTVTFSKDDEGVL